MWSAIQLYFRMDWPIFCHFPCFILQKICGMLRRAASRDIEVFDNILASHPCSPLCSLFTLYFYIILLPFIFFTSFIDTVGSLSAIQDIARITSLGREQLFEGRSFLVAIMTCVHACRNNTQKNFQKREGNEQTQGQNSRAKSQHNGHHNGQAYQGEVPHIYPPARLYVSFESLIVSSEHKFTDRLYHSRFSWPCQP